MGALKRIAVAVACLLLLVALLRDLKVSWTQRLWTAARQHLRYISIGELPFGLVEVSGRTGVVNPQRKMVPHPSLENLAPWMGAMSAGVAVADYDGDGWQDIYLTNSAVGSRNRLFRNNRDGTFTDAAQEAGLADVNRGTGSSRPLFFDYDNDGDKDLLLTTYHRARLFRNKGDGTFEDVTARSGLRHRGFASASNVFDYDADGDLDIVLGEYFPPHVNLLEPTDYRIMHAGHRSSENGGRAKAYRNNGDGSFSRVKGDLGFDCPRWITTIGVYDLRGTGRPDIHFANDYNLNCLYFNEGGGRFVDASAELSDVVSMSNMSSEFAEVFNEGRPSLFVSNIWAEGHVEYGNLLWKMTESGRFEDISGRVGVDKCGWAWGAKFLDLDNDTLQDLVVVNGYVSADRSKDYMPTFVRMTLRKPQDQEDARNWPPIGDASHAGYQQGCVYHNRGDRFRDVTIRTGMRGDLLDGRGLAVIDYLNNGSPGLIVANQGQHSRFYHNERRTANRWIGFKLVGTRSNRDAFGSRVALRLKGGATLRRQLHPANGFMAQSDDRLHFGLGPKPVIEEVTIRWPAGGVQKLKGLELDRYHTIKESAGTG